MSSPMKLNMAAIEVPVVESIISDEEEVINMDALEEENCCQMEAKAAATKAKK